MKMKNDIDGKTKLIGLIGSPISHSKSPKLQNASFDAIGENFAYLAFDIGRQSVKEALDALKLLGARGCNVTFPIKQEVVKYLDEVDYAAKLSGAVNTVVIEPDGSTTGYNTDGSGFVTSLGHLGLDIRDKKIVIVGAGGAGRALSVSLAKSGVKEIVIADKYDEKSAQVRDIVSGEIKKAVKARTVKSDEQIISDELKDAYMLINATPLGMGNSDDCIISSPDLLPENLKFVYDIVYGGQKSVLLRYAEQRGIPCSNGIPLMICQGLNSCKLWTGKSPDFEHAMDLIK